MSTFLHRALALDAVATGLTAGLLLAAATALSDLLGLPAALLRGAGLVLLPFVALVAWAASRPWPARGTVLAIGVTGCTAER